MEKLQGQSMEGICFGSPLRFKPETGIAPKHSSAHSAQFYYRTTVHVKLFKGSCDTYVDSCLAYVVFAGVK